MLSTYTFRHQNGCGGGWRKLPIFHAQSRWWWWWFKISSEWWTPSSGTDRIAWGWRHPSTCTSTNEGMDTETSRHQMLSYRYEEQDVGFRSNWQWRYKERYKEMAKRLSYKKSYKMYKQLTDFMHISENQDSTIH